LPKYLWSFSETIESDLMKHLISISIAFIMSLFVASSAGAEDAKPAEWLFVHTAETAEMTSPTTLVMPVERDIFAFTDRPNRRHAYLTAEQFAGLWADGKGDSFKADPPNAVLTWVLGDTVREAEVFITGAAAASGGKNLVYRVKFEVGTDLGPSNFFKNASLFIDVLSGRARHIQWGPPTRDQGGGNRKAGLPRGQTGSR
jgi:hypothetical protein